MSSSIKARYKALPQTTAWKTFKNRNIYNLATFFFQNWCWRSLIGSDNEDKEDEQNIEDVDGPDNEDVDGPDIEDVAQPKKNKTWYRMCCPTGVVSDGMKIHDNPIQNRWALHFCTKF